MSMCSVAAVFCGNFHAPRSSAVIIGAHTTCIQTLEHDALSGNWSSNLTAVMQLLLKDESYDADVLT